jgi:glycosyltransferase involved in cell wall biosynthesis
MKSPLRRSDITQDADLAGRQAPDTAGIAGNVSQRLPRVVACMPAYRSVSFIRPVLESLAAQTYRNLEILISVDVCTDGTADVCEIFAEQHSNVRVIRQAARLGWIGNSNALLRAADGDYLFFAFHDDPLKPQYVERLVHALEQRPQATVAFSDMQSAGGVRAYPDLDGVTDCFERVRRLMFVYGRWWIPFRGLIRIGVIRSVGGLRRLLVGEQHADWLWLLRLACHGEFVRVPEPLIVKVQNETGVQAGWKTDVRNEIAAQIALIDIIKGTPVAPMQKARLYVALLKSWSRSVRNTVKQTYDAAHAGT